MSQIASLGIFSAAGGFNIIHKAKLFDELVGSATSHTGVQVGEDGVLYLWHHHVPSSLDALTQLADTSLLRNQLCAKLMKSACTYARRIWEFRVALSGANSVTSSWATWS